MAKRLLDWSKVKSIIPPQDFTVVNEQRARHLELNRILSTAVPQLDLEAYRSKLRNTEVVEQVAKQLKSFQPVKADITEVLQSLKTQKTEAVEEAKKTVNQVQNTVTEFKTDLEGIKNLAHYDAIKPDDVYESAPGLEKVYHDRLRKGKVYHDDHNFGEKFFG